MAAPLRVGLGLPILWAVWMAIVYAREVGVVFLLSCMALVWVADIAAYFGGRLLGGTKLAPRISPGKTWSGAATGLVAVLAVAGAWAAWGPGGEAVPSLVSRLVERWGVPLAGLALAGLTAMSVVGDLFESLVKRAVGVKDSSGLLPGHGGVLDRVDALLPVLPLCIMLTA
jgi:phosphatidate cytidylyltransferase